MQSNPMKENISTNPYRPSCVEVDRPRVDEDRLDVEDHEEHRDDVEAGGVSRLDRGDIRHAALVWGRLRRRRLRWRHDQVEDQQRVGHRECRQHHQANDCPVSAVDFHVVANSGSN